MDKLYSKTYEKEGKNCSNLTNQKIYRPKHWRQTFGWTDDGQTDVQDSYAWLHQYKFHFILRVYCVYFFDCVAGGENLKSRYEKVD